MIKAHKILKGLGSVKLMSSYSHFYETSSQIGGHKGGKIQRKMGSGNPGKYMQYLRQEKNLFHCRRHVYNCLCHSQKQILKFMFTLYYCKSLGLKICIDSKTNAITSKIRSMIVAQYVQSVIIDMQLSPTYIFVVS